MRIQSIFLAAVFTIRFVSGQTASSPPASSSGLDMKAIDQTANPCTDFFQYSCGTWIKNNPIPPDQSSWNRFSELHERNLDVLREIAEDAQKNRARSAVDQKVGDFYGACMDEGGIEQKGITPLQPELDRIAKLSSKQDLIDVIARLHLQHVNALFAFGSSPDPNDAKTTIADLDQGGLGLPEKDFYTRTDAKSKDVRQKYVAHVATMFKLLKVPDAQAQQKAARILEFETALANASLEITLRRDPTRLVHKYKVEQLAALSPQFDLNKYFVQIGVPKFAELNVDVPDFVKGFNAELAKTSVNDLKDYFTWQLVNANADLLPKAFVDADFAFFRQTLTGAKQLRPRWKRCVESTDNQLGEALGQKYVERTFGKEGKQRTLELVGQIERSMASDIDSLTWMSAETKKQAMVKLHAVTNKIGYPEKWRDYSAVNIVEGDYLGNNNRAREFEAKRQNNKIGKPVDRTEWGMTPPTINAYYSPLENNINFPAGILQPPFYSNKADDAVNYGGIGAVIGHELTHGFDDQGRQFDADGNLRDWWQKQDAERFNNLAECIVKEYSGFSPVPGVKLNGKLTLGENAADNGGLRLAYTALMNNLALHSEQANAKMDGFDASQRFFMGWGQVWCENRTEQLSRLRAQTDPHSPGKFRVNGTVSNSPEFSKAFGCKASDAMFADPQKACRLW